jgi:SAM-dependent methyltransferase
LSDRRSTETALQESWIANAEAWTRVVRAGSVASRRLATDAAIVEAVSARVLPPGRVLDLGCGEGWLARALAARGIEVTGVDASAPLIDAARRAMTANGGLGGRSTFVVLGYDELAAAPAKAGTGYGAAVANFSLLGEDLTPVLRAVRHALVSDEGGNRDGVLIVQTVHPMACGAPYRDGWRTEDFRGFGESGRGGGSDGEPWRPMPWFFRTVGSWFALLREARYEIQEVREPLHPETEAPLSLLIVGKPARADAGRFGEDAAG